MIGARFIEARFWTNVVAWTHSAAPFGALIRAAGLGTQLLVLILIARLLPKSVFGDAILVFTAYRMLSYAIGSGIGSLLVYHVARDDGAAALDLYLTRRLTLATAVLAGSTGIGCALLAPTISGLFQKPGMTDWLVHMSPLVLFGALLQVTASSLDARNRVTQSILLTELAPNVVRVLGIACVAIWELPGLAVAWMFWLSVAAPWAFDATRLLSRKAPTNIKQLGWADARYAFWLGAYPLLGMQLQGIDMLIVGLLFSSTAVAEYSVASRLATLFPFLQQIVVRVFTPRSGPLFKRNDTANINLELRRLRHLSLASTAAMTAVVLAAAPVIMRVMGDYSAGLGVLIALAIAPLIRSNFAGIEVVLKMRAQGSVLAASAAGTLVLIVTGCWALSGPIGLFALPISMLVSAISINAIIAWRVRQSHVQIADWNLAPLIVCACVLLTVAILWLPPLTNALVSAVAMIVVAWLAIGRPFGMPRTAQ
jgi:O-antigen/teichoic acid export membrane protein